MTVVVTARQGDSSGRSGSMGENIAKSASQGSLSAKSTIRKSAKPTHPPDTAVASGARALDDANDAEKGEKVRFTGVRAAVQACVTILCVQPVTRRAASKLRTTRIQSARARPVESFASCAERLLVWSRWSGRRCHDEAAGANRLMTRQAAPRLQHAILMLAPVAIDACSRVSSVSPKRCVLPCAGVCTMTNTFACNNARTLRPACSCVNVQAQPVQVVVRVSAL